MADSAMKAAFHKAGVSENHCFLGGKNEDGTYDTLVVSKNPPTTEDELTAKLNGFEYKVVRTTKQEG